jgi:hypothetical protein
LKVYNSFSPLPKLALRIQKEDDRYEVDQTHPRSLARKRQKESMNCIWRPKERK